ncbi:SDR family oxidoreductase [Nocardia sp. NPDC049190]|uniref:SDR family oxidoreductase n=1 Tax=Nocardia sp. NPDC049190 TaxID=3155650 RepID=UPI0033FDD09A
MAGPRSHLVTGGTGFVGRALILELLARTDADVICLVRPPDSSDAEHSDERLHEALMEAAVAYGSEESVGADIARRCRAVAGDLDGALDDLATTMAGQVDQIWHCAASLRYRERDREAVERTNIDGTGRMLRFAGAVGASAFHYLSTAYVVGTANGHLLERPVEAGTSNNVYEETKVRAEELVLTQAPAGLRVTILRPSVVVGHSVTSAVSGSLTGIYGLGYHLGSYTTGERPSGPVRIALDPGDTLDVVPIDQVAREAVGCGLRGTDQAVYHLTGGRPVGVGALLNAWCRAVGLPDPTFVSDPAHLRDPERRLDQRLGFYATYLRGDRRFARINTDAVMGCAPPEGVDDATLGDLCAWYAASNRIGSSGTGVPTSPTNREPEPRRTPADGSAAGVTRIVLVGGGYTSLLAYRALRWRVRRAMARGSVQISIIAPGGAHHFHGWTGELLTGVLALANQRTFFTDVWPDAEVIDGVVTMVDLPGRTVTVRATDAVTGASTDRTTVLHYDQLVLGPGSADGDMVPGLGENALSPKKPAELAKLHQRLQALAADPDAAASTIVVVGGGLAGVEMCAAVSEWFVRAGVRPSPRIVLVHSGAELLPELRPRFRRLANYAHDRLVEYGVDIRTGTRVDKVIQHKVVLADGTVLAADLVIAALGQRPVRIPGTEELERDPDGRMRTDGHLRVPGQAGVWAGGDAAAVPHLVTGDTCPPNALWAIKHGSFIGRNIARDLRGRRPLRFSYLGLGRAGSLGVGKGVLHLYGIQFTGRLAWVLRASLFVRFMPSRRRAVGTTRELVALLGPTRRRIGREFTTARLTTDG